MPGTHWEWPEERQKGSSRTRRSKPCAAVKVHGMRKSYAVAFAPMIIPASFEHRTVEV